MSKLARSAAVLFFAASVAWYYHETVVMILPSVPKPSDFSAYYDAARNILAGHSPFLRSGYIYPPFLALMLTTVAWLPYVTARWIWFLFSHACLLLAAWLMWRA